jgi:hypothetical protein
MYSWIMNQNKHVRDKTGVMINPEYINKWSNFSKNYLNNNTYNRYRKGINQKWDTNLENTIKFIELNKRFPSRLSLNNEEHSLYVWLKNNIKKYNNNNLADNRLEKWNTFWKLYGKYK